MTFAGACRSLDHRLIHREHVHPIDTHARHLVRLCEAVQLLLADCVLYERAHPIEVVLADEDAGQLPKRGHIQAFVKRALWQRSIAEEAAYDFGFLLIDDRKPESGGKRKPATDDRVAAHETQVGVEQMHRTTVPARNSGRFAKQLRHHRAWRGALGKAMAMLAVS